MVPRRLAAAQGARVFAWVPSAIGNFYRCTKPTMSLTAFMVSAASLGRARIKLGASEPDKLLQFRLIASRLQLLRALRVEIQGREPRPPWY